MVQKILSSLITLAEYPAWSNFITVISKHCLLLKPALANWTNFGTEALDFTTYTLEKTLENAICNTDVDLQCPVWHNLYKYCLWSFTYLTVQEKICFILDVNGLRFISVSLHSPAINN